MNRNELTVKNPLLPLKAYPKEQLQEILMGSFLIWISDLLGLTGEESAKRLYNAIPAIEKHFWSLGMEEIKKAFTMYADGELTTKPIPNYFTRILVGQIFNEYRQTKPMPKKEINPKNDMEEVTNIQLYKFFKAYFITGLVNDCYVESAYKWLDENGFLELTKEEKLKYMEDAEVMIILEKKENGNLKDKLSEFKKEDITQSEKVFQAKKLALKTYLKNATIEKGKEIEKKLKP